ncbi:MAG: hypothetical protein HFG80_12080 [Eubacterium sp.]|nr:hypothetical protein [Eubacterium sp.]
MRKRIQNLSLGAVQERRPEIRFSEKKITMTVFENEIKTGFFVIRSINETAFRGIVSSSSPWVQCKENIIQGKEKKITFQADASNRCEGDILSGEFLFVANLGEYALPFEITVKKRLPEFQGRSFLSLEEFVKAAQHNFDEAAKCLADPSFVEIFSPEEARERLCAAGFQRGSHFRMNLEEFLVAAGKKQRITLQLEKEPQEFDTLTDTRKSNLHLSKNTWGYTEMMISVSSDFLQLAKSKYTSMDFVGNRCTIDYFIDHKKLHCGYNFAEIVIKTPYETIRVPVTVHQASHREQNDDKRGKTELLREYIDFRLGRMVKGEWVRRFLEQASCLELKGEEYFFYELMQIQALVINRQRQDAVIRLKEFVSEYHKTTEPNWAYYLYILTLLEREPLVIRKNTNEIKTIYKNYPDSRLCFWILLYLDTDFEDPAFKLMELEQQCRNGFISPVLYLESYKTIEKMPQLLTKLGSFEIRLLNWMRKEKLLSHEIMEVVVTLLPKVSRYEPVIVKILEESYQLLGNTAILEALAAYLIRGRITNSRAGEWYRQAIEKGLNINRLYEAYVMCIDDCSKNKLPEEVLHYFAFENHLPEEKKAQIYLYITKRKEQYENLYPKYEKQIRSFVSEQLKQGRADETFAELYEEVCTKESLDETDWEQFVKVFFTVKLTFRMQGIVKVHVLQEAVKKKSTYPVFDNTVYLFWYPGRNVVIYEDIYGRKFSSETDYEIRQLGNRGKMMAVLGDQVQNILPFQLMHAMTTPDRKLEIPDLMYLTQTEALEENYRNKLIGKLFDHCIREQKEKELAAGMNRVSWKNLQRKERNQYFQIICKNKNWKKAYEIIAGCDISCCDDVQLFSVAADAVRNQSEQDDEMLVYFALKAVLRGCTSETVLKYACEKYCGSLENMLKLWEAAIDARVDTFYLSERILIQLMYCAALPAQAERIFEQYYIGGGNSKVIDAYQAYMSYRYLRGELETPHKLAGRLQLMCEQEEPLPRVCRLAALKSLVLQKKWDDAAFQNMEKLLKEALINNEIFAFYKELPIELKQKYLLDHVEIIEYVGKEGEQAQVVSCEKGFCRIRDMMPTSADTYACPIFLAGKEEKEFYLRVTDDRTMELSVRTVYAAKTASAKKTRLNMLEDMEDLTNQNNLFMLKEDLKQYIALAERIEEEFLLL